MREVHSAEYPGVTHFRGTSLKSSLKYGQLKSIYFLTRDFGKGTIHQLKEVASRKTIPKKYVSGLYAASCSKTNVTLNILSTSARCQTAKHPAMRLFSIWEAKPQLWAHYQRPVREVPQRPPPILSGHDV
ncbi:hypothetical protein CEXT_639331 [Caerostris extrusa]|uniref:Uncharacterized protein n=1 Tax=Caerostris extrusa TaxID=172846 RepID=A0AAV4X380_CAEEX|nr:hypothetical protein CEXT_639331 [Caerostris extrusa]